MTGAKAIEWSSWSAASLDSHSESCEGEVMKNIDMPRMAVIFLTCVTVCTVLNLYGPLATASSFVVAVGMGAFVAAIVTVGLVTLGRADRDRPRHHS